MKTLNTIRTKPLLIHSFVQLAPKQRLNSPRTLFSEFFSFVLLRCRRLRLVRPHTNREFGLKHWKAFRIRAVWNECQFASHVFLARILCRFTFTVSRRVTSRRVALSFTVSRKCSLAICLSVCRLPACQIECESASKALPIDSICGNCVVAWRVKVKIKWMKSQNCLL